MEKKYIELFELIEDVLKQQKAQKLRGLNDYNMVNVVRKATDEVGMHSNVIFSLINPNGLHYQNDLFLNRFIEIVLGFELKEFGKIIGVKAEEQTDKNRRIDFTIKSENYFIGIEMKVNAGDLKNQIAHYDEYLSAEADTQKVMMYYLTKDGKDAPLRSKGSVSIEKVSFQKHILKWLDACQNEVRNITNLNVALEDYKNIVKKITGKYKGNVMSISDVIKKNFIENKKFDLEILIEIEKAMPKIKENIINEFFKEVKEELQKKLGKDWIIELDGVLSKKWKRDLLIYRKNWSDKNKLLFAFEFGRNNYENGYFGIIRNNESISIKTISDNFKLDLDRLLKKLATTKGWLHYEYLTGNDFFLSTLKSKQKFIDDIYSLIEVFELDNGLITKINTYLDKN